MKRVVSIPLAVLFLTAVYVFAWPSANILYFAGVVLHVLGGIAFLAALAFALRRRLREESLSGRIVCSAPRCAWRRLWGRQ